MFGGGVSIALARAAAPPPRMAPDFPMATLTVTGTNSARTPVVFNADNGDRFSNQNAIFSFF